MPRPQAVRSEEPAGGIYAAPYDGRLVSASCRGDSRIARRRMYAEHTTKPRSPSSTFPFQGKVSAKQTDEVLPAQAPPRTAISFLHSRSGFISSFF